MSGCLCCYLHSACACTPPHAPSAPQSAGRSCRPRQGLWLCIHGPAAASPRLSKQVASWHGSVTKADNIPSWHIQGQYPSMCLWTSHVHASQIHVVDSAETSMHLSAQPNMPDARASDVVCLSRPSQLQRLLQTAKLQCHHYARQYVNRPYPRYSILCRESVLQMYFNKLYSF